MTIQFHAKRGIQKDDDDNDNNNKIQHITAACEQLAPTEYVKRHDGLAKVIHQKLAEAVNLTEDKSIL